MGQSIEARKLSILEYLAEVDDEAIIVQIENILKPKVDFWDELTNEQKESIRRGEKDFEEGRKVSFKQFLNAFRGTTPRRPTN